MNLPKPDGTSWDAALYWFGIGRDAASSGSKGALTTLVLALVHAVALARGVPASLVLVALEAQIDAELVRRGYDPQALP